MQFWTKVVLLTAIAAGPSLADDLHEQYSVRHAKARIARTTAYGYQAEHARLPLPDFSRSRLFEVADVGERSR